MYHRGEVGLELCTRGEVGRDYSAEGVSVRVRLDQVTALKGSLDVAWESGRRILLTADHGHTPFVDKSLRRGGKAPSRYVELDAAAPVPEGFMEIDLEGLGGFGDEHRRIAFAWRCGVYNGKQQAGFHGGCSLEELVVPLAWLQRDGLRADEPTWWSASESMLPDKFVWGPGDVIVEAPEIAEPIPEEPATVEPATVEAMVAEPAEPEPGQIGLFGPEDHGLPSELWARLQDDEKKVLDVLRRNGAARVSELASQLGKPAGRVPFMMSRLRRRLGSHSRFEREVLPDGEGLFRYQG